MDEGLRLARLVSHGRAGRLSPCVPAKPPLAGEAAGSAVPRPTRPGGWGRVVGLQPAGRALRVGTLRRESTPNL